MKEQCPVSPRAERIPPFMVMEVLERAQALEREGRSIIHLEVGEPDFETPDCIREAGIRAIREGKTKYSHSLGHLELREAICQDYRREYGVEVTPERIVVTSGTSPAMFLTIWCRKALASISIKIKSPERVTSS